MAAGRIVLKGRFGSVVKLCGLQKRRAAFFFPGISVSFIELLDTAPLYSLLAPLLVSGNCGRREAMGYNSQWVA